MNNSFLNYVDNRKGERLIQGVLLFLLENDREFKHGFCNWVGWEIFSNVQEEYSEGEHRHDLVLFYKNMKKRIELKFWANWTPSQSTTPDTIDLLIVPKVRLTETTENFKNSIVKTWEELEQKVVSFSDIAKVLLSGLAWYYWSPGSLGNYEEYEKAISLAFKSFEYESNFFYKLASKINYNNLSVGNLSFSLKGWKGFFIKNSHLEDHWFNYLWLGIMINADRWNKANSLEFSLILQVCSGKLALTFSDLVLLPGYIGYIGHNEGIIVKPDSEGKYSLESIWDQCESLITQYSHLRLDYRK